MILVIICFLLVINLLENQAQYEEYPLPPFKLILNRTEIPMYEDGHRRLTQSTTAPLFRGLGTHYSFLWVGSPPQRVSVIMDTGSHHTAFPCVGCKCGKHMDPHFDPKQSSTSKTKTCGGKQDKCFFRQSYSEGSSWHAFKVVDRVYIGGEHFKDLSIRANQSVDFEFGCQDSETGLFRTQNVDGIMGLSASEETLPFQLYKNQLTTTKLFTLCFRVGGGILTLGGVDPALNQYKLKRPFTDSINTALPAKPSNSLLTDAVTSLTKSSSNFFFSSSNKPATGTPTMDGYHTSTIQFAKLIKSKGWFTVNVLDIFMKHPKDASVTSITGPIFKCNAGKGTIVDSGTTDTYLPHSIQVQFTNLFRKVTGLRYKNEAFTMSLEQLISTMPIVIIRFESILPNQHIDIAIYPESYFEKIGTNKYVPRIYLTESTGAVLGANFMNEYNVIFDIENHRVGFAQSDCVEELMK